MRHAASEDCGADMPYGVSVGRAVLNGPKAWVEELGIVFVDDQIAGEAIRVRKDRKVVRRRSRVVNLRNQVVREFLLNAERPCLNLGHLIVEVEPAEA